MSKAQPKKKAAPANGIPERMSRYADLVKPTALVQARVAVIGTGAIGRQVAIQLASMGIGEVTLCDFDKVEEGNLGPQGWYPADVGHSKIEAMVGLLAAVNPSCAVKGYDEPFKPAMVKGIDFVLACVDNMDVRKEILEAVDMSRARLFADARMGAEVCRTYHVWDLESRDRWLKTWYPQAEAHQAPCASKATIYCANIAAGLLMASVTKRIRELALPDEFEINLVGMAASAIYPPQGGP